MRSAFLRRAWLVTLWTTNVVLVVITIWGFFVSDAGYDWLIYVEAGRRLSDGTLYLWNETYAWSYSPLLAYFFWLAAPMGYIGWTVAHVAAVLGLRERRLMAVTLLSWPFWADLYNGNTLAFVFVAAAQALRGSRAWTSGYFALFLLMPRPLMAPLVLWLLWRRPTSRWPFALIVAVNALLVMLTGYGAEWFATLTSVSDAVAASARDIGPANLMGIAWVPVGFALAVYLTWRNRLGLASIAASPYWLPQYLLMGLLEIVPGRPTRPSASSRTAPEG